MGKVKISEQNETMLKDLYKKARPDIRDISLGAYVNWLKRAWSLSGNEDQDDLISGKFLKDVKTVNDAINNSNLNYQTKRNIYNAIVVFLIQSGDMKEQLDKYVKLRDDGNQKYRDMQSQGKSEAQEKNWITMDEMNRVIDELKLDFDRAVKGSSNTDKNKMQDYIMLKFHSIIPLRNELSNIKRINGTDFNKLNIEDKQSSNWLVQSKNKLRLVLNVHKTSRKSGTRDIDLSEEFPKEFLSDIKRYLKSTQDEKYFLMNQKRDNHMTSNQYSKSIISLFKSRLGKNVGSSMIRHIYLSEKYGEKNKEQVKDALRMGNSVDVQNAVYIK